MLPAWLGATECLAPSLGLHGVPSQVVAGTRHPWYGRGPSVGAEGKGGAGLSFAGVGGSRRGGGTGSSLLTPS